MFGISWLTDKIAAGIAGFLLVSTIALGIGLVVTRTTLHTRTVELQAEKAAHEADIQKWAAATATAQLQDQQHSDAVKAAQDKITTENSNALDTKLSDAHAAVADFVRKQAADDKRGSNTPNLPATPDATGQAAATDQSAVVSRADLDACADAYVKATGWADWYRQQVQLNNADQQSQNEDQPQSAPVAQAPALNIGLARSAFPSLEYGQEISHSSEGEPRLANLADEYDAAYSKSSQDVKYHGDLISGY